jgi:hypothetical protein
MIIVSSGFPKSASTLLFLYTEEILKQSGKRSAQEKFRKRYPEGFIHRFGLLNTTYLFFLNLFFGSVVVKTHAGPNFFLRVLIKMKIAKAYYSIRDPRDVILSALDHGKKARANGSKTPADKAFEMYEKKEDLYAALKMHYENFDRWKHFNDKVFVRFKPVGGWRKEGLVERRPKAPYPENEIANLAEDVFADHLPKPDYVHFPNWKIFKNILFVRYENLLASPETELKNILKLLNWEEQEKLLPGIIESFAKKKSETKNFNKGEISRFEKEFSADELKEIEKEISRLIIGMGYELRTNI